MRVGVYDESVYMSPCVFLSGTDVLQGFLSKGEDVFNLGPGLNTSNPFMGLVSGGAATTAAAGAMLLCTCVCVYVCVLCHSAVCAYL